MRYYILVLTLCCSFLCSCVTTKTNEFEESPETPKEERIPQLIQILHIAKAQNYWRLCQEIISYKEDALDDLAKNITSASTNIRIGSMYCVSQIYKITKSSEALALKDIIYGRLDDPSEEVQLEAAAALCDMEDYRGVPVLIGIGLRNKKSNVRLKSFNTLKTTFKVTHNYEYRSSQEERESGVNQWEEWWHKNKNKYLTSTS